MLNSKAGFKYVFFEDEIGKHFVQKKLNLTQKVVSPTLNPQPKLRQPPQSQQFTCKMCTQTMDQVIRLS